MSDDEEAAYRVAWGAEGHRFASDMQAAFRAGWIGNDIQCTGSRRHQQKVSAAHAAGRAALLAWWERER